MKKGLSKEEIAAQRSLSTVKNINLFCNIKQLRRIQKRLWKLGVQP